MMIGWARSSPSFGEIERATRSLEPPGGNGTRSRIGFAGYCANAHAAPTQQPSTRHMIRQRVAIIEFGVRTVTILPRPLTLEYPLHNIEWRMINDMSAFKQSVLRIEERLSEASAAIPQPIRWIGGLAAVVLLAAQFVAGLIKF